ncbi:cytochrome c3 family protein [bacterium]|nr:cytochrome c3 family protein [candidate division CSSED10-310 bacterium]
MFEHRLKKWIARCLIAAVFLGTGFALAQISEMKKDIIIIPTPEKKSEGVPTRTVFAHKKHVDEYGASCETCHPEIAFVEGSPDNQQDNVHEVCRKCHAKNKPGKSFLCAKCHEK